jgi:prevent-host-death family protein
MKYTVNELRAKTREALNKVEDGEPVYIVRYNTLFKLVLADEPENMSDRELVEALIESGATDPEAEEDEQEDIMANWIWEERTHTLWDTATGEALESDPDTIKELKRRGQVK